MMNWLASSCLASLSGAKDHWRICLVFLWKHSFSVLPSSTMQNLFSNQLEGNLMIEMSVISYMTWKHMNEWILHILDPIEVTSSSPLQFKVFIRMYSPDTSH